MAEPLTVQELKKRIDVVRDDIDDVLAALIIAGREWVESYVGHPIDPANVPETFKAAISIYVRAMHEDGAISESYRIALEALCYRYRTLAIA